ncbi:lysoplasmalogenase [Gordonia aurantiaca]|uniref:lysoplasmalogenase n=1 Tax=Gordonia sp. B21 TaxID=3151852 RepID=UPI003265D049
MGPRLPSRRVRDLAFAATTAVATVSGALGHRRIAGLTKPLPMLILAADTAAGAPGRGAADNAGLAGALVFSMAGDVLMFLEEFETEPDAKDRYLRRGATLFAAAQLSYIATMWRAGARPSSKQLLPRVGLLGESATVLARHRPALLPVLGAYGNTLATMSAMASAMPDTQPRLRIGGLAFLLSDLAIINRRHLVRDRRLRIAGEAWVLASYFTAQYLLICGLAERSRRGGPQ